MRKVKIVSTGKYLPKTVVTSMDVAKKMNTTAAWVEKKSGVKKRHFATDETSPQMGAKAALEALENAGIEFNKIDALIGTCGTPAQPIPCTAALIQEALEEKESGVPCFDINSTCLSFVTGLDVASSLIEQGRFNRILLVSSERASVGLNYQEKESASLMGDGAAAVIIERSNESSHIICSKMETYSSGARHAEIKGGGSNLHAIRGENAKEQDFYFKMDGKKIFKQASQMILPFIDRLFFNTNINIQDFDLVIPHQASGMGLRVIQKKLKLKDHQFYNYIEDHGNTVASSIPMGLHNAITKNKIKRGDKVLLLGTSAGFSVGGVAFEY